MKSILLLIVGATLVMGRVLTRTTKEIEELKISLDKSEFGLPHESINPAMVTVQHEWERSGKFEGDIILTEEQKGDLVNQFSGKNAMTSINKWLNNTVVYDINLEDFDPKQVASILTAMAYISNVSCITFKIQTDSDPDYVFIQGKPVGCYSSIGRTGGVQILNLAANTPGEGCFIRGNILHELNHALGFYHMHSTYDRDEHIRVVWDRVQSGAVENFLKYSSAVVSNLGVPYDFGSVMHYSEYAFSVNGDKTIEPLEATTDDIGQRVEMSESDIKKLNLLYKCNIEEVKT